MGCTLAPPGEYDWTVPCAALVLCCLQRLISYNYSANINKTLISRAAWMWQTFICVCQADTEAEVMLCCVVCLSVCFDIQRNYCTFAECLWNCCKALQSKRILVDSAGILASTVTENVETVMCYRVLIAMGKGTVGNPDMGLQLVSKLENPNFFCVFFVVVVLCMSFVFSLKWLFKTV